MSLAEGDVMKREKSLGGLFGRLLAVEYGVGRLFPSINVPSSDPYQPGPAIGGPRHTATRLASYSSLPSRTMVAGREAAPCSARASKSLGGQRTTSAAVPTPQSARW